MDISVTQRFQFDAAHASAEMFFRTYHESHPELHLDRPCSDAVIAQLNLAIEESIRQAGVLLTQSYLLQQVEPLISAFFGDTLLNSRETDILATAHPNFAPAFFHEHAYFELAYVAQGTCKNFCGNRELEMNTGDLLILAPGTRHAISSFSESCRVISISIRAASFEQTFFKAFRERNVLYRFFSKVLYHYETNTYLLFHTGEDGFLCSCVLNLVEGDDEQRPRRESFKKTLVSLLFSYLLDHYEQQVDVFTDANMEKRHEIALMLRMMQDRYADLTLPALSHAFGYSTRQMDRILLSYTGRSFQDNLQDIRMQMAKTLLKEDKLSVEAIAERLGYATASNFRKIFKKYYNLSPKQYQMNRRSKAL